MFGELFKFSVESARFLSLAFIRLLTLEPVGFFFFVIFSVAISVSPHVCFILDLILSSMFLRECTYELGTFHANQTT